MSSIHLSPFNWISSIHQGTQSAINLVCSKIEEVCTRICEFIKNRNPISQNQNLKQTHETSIEFGSNELPKQMQNMFRRLSDDKIIDSLSKNNNLAKFIDNLESI